MRGKKKVESFNEYYESNVKNNLAVKHKKSLDNARGDSANEEKLIDDLQIKTGKYSLKTRIKTNPWVKAGRPATKAQSWLFKEVFKNPAIYHYNKRLLFQGGLFMFDYKNPKFKDTKSLPWFDKYPLVLSLGPVVTKLGIRNLGFNLHLLPPKIRIIVLCRVFELYKKLYRYQIFFKREKPVQIRYQHIIKGLKPYGVTFCVRMYIPQRQNHIVNFPYRDWYKAVFVPSMGYDSIRAAKLINEWTKFVRKQGYATRDNLNWKSII